MASFGGTEFTALVTPPGSLLDSYKHDLRSDKQDNSIIPQTFLDAMLVREEVFVDEQNCSLENEVDSDDARSYHWVIYASKGAASSPSAHTSNDPHKALGGTSTGTSSGLARAPSIGNRKASVDATATRTPIATIRLVPPPHPAHPTTSSHVPVPLYHEPYVKLTRLAVRKKYRGMNLSKLLISTALKYAVAHALAIAPPPSPAWLEQQRLQGDEEAEHREMWKGLVLVHAQLDRRAFWERFGFVWDKGLGQWDEEGIQHVGLWLRLPMEKA